MSRAFRTLQEVYYGSFLCHISDGQACLTQLHPDGDLGEFIKNPDLQYTDNFNENRYK